MNDEHGDTHGDAEGTKRTLPGDAVHEAVATGEVQDVGAEEAEAATAAQGREDEQAAKPRRKVNAGAERARNTVLRAIKDRGVFWPGEG